MRKNHKADTVLLEPEQDVAHKSKFQQQLAEDMRKNRAPRIWVVLFKRTLRDLNTRLCNMDVCGALVGQGAQIQSSGVTKVDCLAWWESSVVSRGTTRLHHLGSHAKPSAGPQNPVAPETKWLPDVLCLGPSIALGPSHSALCLPTLWMASAVAEATQTLGSGAFQASSPPALPFPPIPVGHH